MTSVRFQGKPFNIIVIQVYAEEFTSAEEAEADRFCEDLEDLLELTPEKDVLLISGLEGKSRKARDTWSQREVWPWSTK